MNVTVTNPSGPGFVTVWPCGQPCPLASNLNYGHRPDHPQPHDHQAGHRRQGLLLLDGHRPMSSPTSPATSPPARATRRANPTRILDTRDGTGRQPPAGQHPLQLQVGGLAGCARQRRRRRPERHRHQPLRPRLRHGLALRPAHAPRLQPQLRRRPDHPQPHHHQARHRRQGLHLLVWPPTDVIADVAGYFPAGSDYIPVTNPTRILDTRNGTGAAASRRQRRCSSRSAVSPACPPTPPPSSSTSPSPTPQRPGFVTVWPCGQPRPSPPTSTTPPARPSRTSPSPSSAPSGKVCIYSMAATDVIADVAGYFPAGSGYMPIQPHPHPRHPRAGRIHAAPSPPPVRPEGRDAAGGRRLLRDVRP